MTDIPPGWYDDPEQPANFRYWDGGQWTDHRSPKSGPAGRDQGVWAIVPEAFRLLGRGWRQLVVLALPLAAVMIVGGILAFTAADSAFDPSLADILDRVAEPGFDPINDAGDEAFIESIKFSVTAGVIVAFIIAFLLLYVGGMIASVSFTVFLMALQRNQTLSVSQTYGIVLPRLARIIGILLLWTIVWVVAFMALGVVSVVLVLITPLTLLVLVPLGIAGAIYLYPFAAMAMTTLAVAPVNDPPLRRTISLIRPRWGAVAVRLLVLTLVFWGVGWAVSLITTPFAGSGLWAAVLLSMVVQAVQTVFSAAGSVVLYDFTDGPVAPEIEMPTT